MARQEDLFGQPLAATRSPSRGASVADRPSRVSPPRGGLFGDRADGPPRTASERQASFASDISHGLGIPLPMEGDGQSIGEFITRHRKEFEDHFRRKRQRR